MFYQVDYLLALMVAGFLIGAMLSRLAGDVSTSRLARSYYALVAILLVLRVTTFAWTTLANRGGFAGTAGAVAGDMLTLLLGMAFGLAVKRRDARAFLTDRSLIGAFYVYLSFIFALAGIGKAFSMAPMTEFFTQSGYSAGFLRFIVIAELIGALGMLLPWARIPAWTGLTVDMFGAVLTHIHNRDPLNDSTGAIGMLLRLVAVAILWNLQQRDPAARPQVSKVVLRVGVATAICLSIAAGGGALLRHQGLAAIPAMK